MKLGLENRKKKLFNFISTKEEKSWHGIVDALCLYGTEPEILKAELVLVFCKCKHKEEYSLIPPLLPD